MNGGGSTCHGRAPHHLHRGGRNSLAKSSQNGRPEESDDDEMADGGGVSSFPDLTIGLGDQPELLRKARELVLKVRPGWAGGGVRDKVFSGGVSNVLVGVYPEGRRDEMVLVRVYGHRTELIIDRRAEIANMRRFHASGCGPALLATFANGIAYEFVPGDILSTEMVVDPAVNQLVIEMFARMHRMDVGDARPCMWDRMRKFHAASPDGFPDDEEKQGRYRACGILSKLQLAREIDEMERELSGSDSPVVHCHNDLLLGNIIYAGGKVTFIDHEYGAPNYQAFDLGNHFTEFVGIGDQNLDYENLYPKEDFQKDWLRRYLAAYDGRQPTSEEVHRLYVLVNKFSLCANLKWGIWALVQAKNSSIDFDFIDYAMQRLNEYRRRKPQFLALK